MASENTGRYTQLRFNEEFVASKTQEVGSKLGYDVLGLAQHPETFLNLQFQELIVESKLSFPTLSPELQLTAQRLQEKEIGLLDTGLPKAPDAEKYFDPTAYALKTVDGGVRMLTNEEVIGVFNSGDISQLVMIQAKFQTPEEIELSLGKVNQAIDESLADITQLLKDPILLHLNLPVNDQGDVKALPAETINSIQKLGVLDVHYRNLRDIARTFYMYQAMTLGNCYPIGDQAESILNWQLSDTPEQLKMRGQAESVSMELYGDLRPELWSETLYKHLESVRFSGNSEQIDDLERNLLPNMSELKQRVSSREIELLHTSKEKGRIESVTSRCVRFSQAAESLGKSSELTTLDQRLKLRQEYLSLIESVGLKTGVLQKSIDSYMQTQILTTHDIDLLGRVENPNMLIFLGYLVANKDANLAKFIALRESFGDQATSIQMQDLIDLVNVTEKDLKEFSPNDSFAEKSNDLEFIKYARRSSIDFAHFLQNMMTDMGVESVISIEDNQVKLKSDPSRPFSIVLTEKGSVNVSTVERSIRIPIARLFSARHMANLFGHEIMAHIGGASRVAETGAGLINTFSSNGPNEGFAVVLGETVSAMINDQPQEKLDLTQSGEGGIDQIYRMVKAREYGLQPEQLSLPVDAGTMHIIALGLHLGYGQEKRRNLQEVFNTMKQIYAVENRFKGQNESDIEKKAGDDAFQVGVYRQARGLWDRVTTKNMSYSVGGLVIRQMLESRHDLSELSYGKIGHQHQAYRTIFGLKPESLDQKWRYVNRSSLIKHLGLAKSS